MNISNPYRFGSTINPLVLNPANYTLEETSGTAVIDTLSGQNGVNYATRGVPGKYGNAYSFNGTSEYIDLSVLNDFWNNQSFTIGMYIKTTYSGSNVRIFQNRGTGSFSALQEQGFQFCIGTTYANTGFVWKNVSHINYSSNACNIRDGAWHHLALTWEASEGRSYIYEDGVQVATALNFSMVGADLRSVSGRNTLVGKADQNTQYFPGDLDHIRILNYAATTAQIQGLM